MGENLALPAQPLVGDVQRVSVLPAECVGCVGVFLMFDKADDDTHRLSFSDGHCVCCLHNR